MYPKSPCCFCRWNGWGRDYEPFVSGYRGGITGYLPIHHVKQGLPPTIWFCGTADPLYPQNLQFIEAMNQCGTQIDFYTYEGMEHGFFNYGLHDNKPYIETTKQMIKFFQVNL